MWRRLLLVSALLWLGNFRIGWFRNARVWWYRATRPQIAVFPEAKDDLVRSRLAALEQENGRLRRLLGAPLPPAWQFIPAGVVSAGEDGWIIAAGGKDGLTAGMNVLVLGGQEGKSGILLGRIDGVEDYLARVRPADNVRAVTAAGAAGRVIIEAGRLRLEEVEQKFLLTEGDQVLSAGGDGWLPGLLIGRTGAVESVPTAVYQSAAVIGAVDPALLTQVAVVRAVAPE